MSNASHVKLFQDISFSSLTSLNLKCESNVDLVDVLMHFKSTRCLRNLYVVSLGAERCTSKFVSNELAKILRCNRQLTLLYVSCIELGSSVIESIYERVLELGLIQMTIPASLIDRLAKGSLRRLSLFYASCSDETLQALIRLVSNSTSLRDLLLTGFISYNVEKIRLNNQFLILGQEMSTSSQKKLLNAVASSTTLRAIKMPYDDFVDLASIRLPTTLTRIELILRK